MKKLCLSILFIAFVGGQIARLETPYGVGVVLLDILVMGGGILYFLYQWHHKKIVFDQLLKSFSIFLLFGGVSLLLNPLHLSVVQMGVASLYLFRFAAYGLLFFSIISEQKEIKAFLKKCLLVSGVSIVVLGFLQFFLYGSLRNLYYLGWDEHLHRLFSVFLDPNFAGMFFVLFLFYLFYLFFHSSFSRKNIAAGIFITLLALLLTYSRSAYLCLFVGTIVFFVIEKKKKELGIFLASLAVLILILLPTFNTHNTDLFRVASTLSRVHSYTQGWTIARDHLFLGIGFNAYRYAVHAYHFHIPTDIAYNHSEGGNDNSYLLVLATTGIIGFISYGIFLYYLVRRILRSGKARSFLLASLLTLCIGGFFNNALFYTPLLFWLYMSIGSTENT